MQVYSEIDDLKITASPVGKKSESPKKLGISGRERARATYGQRSKSRDN